MMQRPRYLRSAWTPALTVAFAFLVTHPPLRAQEQVDKLERQKQAAAAIGRMTMRVRVVKCMPEAERLVVEWRRGGEGLGGTVTRGRFAAPDSAELQIGRWSDWLPTETVCGRAKGWEFPSVTVAYPLVGKKQPDPPSEVAVEFEWAERGAKFKSWVETAPRGATVGFAFPAATLDDRGSQNPDFVRQLNGLAAHARQRRELLERQIGASSSAGAVPRKFGVLGHLAGFGQGPGSGLGKAVGFGVRHCNPEIVADECRTLQLLGINGLVDEKSVRMVELSGQAENFRRIYWGGPGSGSPMAAVSSRGAGEPDGCPFDPRLKTTMAEQVERAIAQHRASGASELWGLWWDEIGVASKAHLNDCPRCRDAFRDYLRAANVAPGNVGASDWSAVATYPLWTTEQTKSGLKQSLAPPPSDAPAVDKLRYYYTYRFMTHATANLFPDSARRLREAGINLYAMQGPTPSWNGSSLDWHEFYDRGANTALVWETSNRDPRAWQWESYLADIMRGISARHGDLPIGCLVKPHRGAPQQRMLTGVARGVRALEWYTYGPDYAKGDSFSQSAELLEQVADAGRFLAQAEPRLWEARFASEPETAFVFPRSSEIWGRAGQLGMTALEDAKWVYLALRHEHIPVAVFSEQQLAEGLPARIKTLYVVGPNLRRDATRKVADWVRGGGTLWTDALGLSRDESDEPNTAATELFGSQPRTGQQWAATPEYRATTLEPISDAKTPESAVARWERADAWGRGEVRAVVGREQIAPGDSETVARFADASPAATQRKVGRGQVVRVALWAGLAYSARVRRPDYDMHVDFDPAARRLVTAAALESQVARDVVPAHPLVEAITLRNAQGRSIALINWCYSRSPTAAGSRGETPRTHADLPIEFDLPADATTARSLRLGVDLPITRDGRRARVVLPKLETIDLIELR